MANRRTCITMFSGGRDSTLAAVRLAADGLEQVLVTVTSAHLLGLTAVHRRLVELTRLLPAGTRWLNVRQAATGPEDQAFQAPTCFPCHKAYVASSVQVAALVGAECIAFGYAGYQNAWPEQTPRAVNHLREILAARGLTLLTPVYGIRSKAEAEADLRRLGLSAEALEQKCLVQANNHELGPGAYEREFAAWSQALEAVLSREGSPLDLIGQGELPWDAGADD